MKIFVTTPQGPVFDSFFPPENIRLAESLGEIIWNESTEQYTTEQVMEKIGDCDVYMTTWSAPNLDARIMDAAPNLKIMTHLCGSVKPYAADEVWDRGLKVISGNRFFAESVAEGALAYMLASLRDIPYYSRRLKEEHLWKPVDFKNQGLAGKKIGIVSYGAIARNLVRILSVFRVELYVYDIIPLPEEDVQKYNLHQASLDEIFSSCDIISIHTPKIPATYHMINAHLLSLIRPGALFVNTARGAVIDQKALEKELADGRFRAALDVYDPEPPEDDNPMYDMPNVLMMPHMGGPTMDLRKFIARELLLETAGYLTQGSELPSEITKKMASTMTV